MTFKKDHPREFVIGEPHKGIKIWSSFKDSIANLRFISEIEPNNVDEALKEDSWVVAMHDELNQFTRNNVWYLVPKPKDYPIIGTK